ncbi:hypothetical protein ACJIZ3_006582 [Penstemon smallii]|uniref:Uncharacterized protein n=1 Tax=Penstemon smallii TaxID=265156 RepID=A0ABD3S890_9LAMI
MHFFIIHFRTLFSHLVFLHRKDVRIIGNLSMCVFGCGESVLHNGFLFYNRFRYLIWLSFLTLSSHMS